MTADRTHRFRAASTLLWAAALASLLAGCGAKLIPYVPNQTAMTAAEAMRVVQRTIETQPGDHIPYGVAVTPEKLTISKHATQILYFDDLWKTDLHSKRNYFLVRFWDGNRHGFRIYTSDQRDAERFVDALHVLSEENKLLATRPEPERSRRIRAVERQRRELEMEIDVSEGPIRD